MSIARDYEYSSVRWVSRVPTVFHMNAQKDAGEKSALFYSIWRA